MSDNNHQPKEEAMPEKAKPEAEASDNVAKMPREYPRVATMPTTESARHDGLLALVDGIAAGLASETTKARKALDRFDQTVLDHTARIKTELESLFESAEALKRNADSLIESVDSIRAKHAKLVNARVHHEEEKD